MPEMKRTFTKGRMNKDFDERLVPNGEYRDAMNIQVSTSEGSDVGTIQNVLGNTPGCVTNLAPVGSYTVGSVSDEKNDTLYWLVSGQADAAYYMKDMILRRRPDPTGGHICEPVFVDNFAFSVSEDSAGAGTFGNAPNTSSISLVDLIIANQVQEGWTVTGVAGNGSLSNTVTIVDVITEDLESFSWNFTTSNNPTYTDFCVGFSPFCNGSDIVMPHSCIFPCGGSHNTVNGMYDFVYLTGYVGNEADLIGNYIDLDPYSSGANIIPGPHSSPTPGFQIINAAIVGITSQAGFSSNYVKLTLDGFPTFTPGGLYDTLGAPWAPVFLPGNVDAATGDGLSQLGNVVGNIAGIITEGTASFSTVPDNGWITVSNVSGWQVNDTITLNPGTLFEFSGCINAIDSGNSWVQVVDCSDPTIFAEPYVINPALDQYAQVGTLQADATVTLDFGNQDLDLSQDNYTEILLQGPRVLNFNHDELILGINIIDEFLIWTDNKTEPKKISIPRSVAGTNPSGNIHTDLMLPDSSGNIIINKGAVKEEHITVIRKAPHRPPTLDMSTESRGGNAIGDGYTLSNIFSPGLGTTNYFNAIGEILYVDIADLDNVACDFKVSDILGLHDGTGVVTGEDMFGEGYQIRLKILEINTGPWTNPNPNGAYGAGGDPVGPSALGITTYLVEVVSLSQDVNISATSSWFLQLEENDEFLFEHKLPRFAYRYKYVDNEYSTYGPFSNVAFSPGVFSYQPVKAYNEGMTNKLKSLVLKDFIPNDIPKDVVQVDLLYKNDNSPLVYLIDSIKELDAPLLNNAWHAPGSNSLGAKGSYNVLTENIYAALPANQTIRTWDSVPTIALAQDVTGNRIVYGNYQQGYDMEEIEGSGTGNLIPDINVSLAKKSGDIAGERAKKSIKSLRNYDIGVVWGDKYGRETPVITPSSGSLVVAKKDASFANYIQASLNKSPFWADYYRFYIKETSNQYYNLPVDRIYDAEDGNVWVSFPSVDRNKIDEDTYIVLKKGSDTDALVEKKARYKVVAIENEAPDFIKTNYEILARTNTDSTTYVSSCQLFGGQLNIAANSNAGSDGLGNGCSIYPNPLGHITPPRVGRKAFTIDKKHWVESYSTSPKRMGLPDLKKIFKDITADATSDEFYVSFTKETTVVGGTTSIVAGSKYRVLEIITHEGAPGSGDDGDANLGTTVIGFDDGSSANSDVYEVRLSEPIKTTDEFVVSGYDSVTGQLANDYIHIHFWKKTMKNSPEFDGRFFVKIYSDGDDRDNLKNAPDAVRNWAIVATRNLYKIDDNASPTWDTTDDTWNFNTNAPNSDTNKMLDWQDLLKFSGNDTEDNWFIDGASFASRQPLGNISHYNAITGYTDSGGTTYDSSDITSAVPFDMHDPGGNYGIGVTSSLLAAFGIIPTNFGTGLSEGRVGMKGAHTTSLGYKKLDLSYSKVGNPGGEDFIVLHKDGYTTYSNLNWDIGEIGANSFTDQESVVVEQLKNGTRFRLAGSDLIYKIEGVTKLRLFNYQGKVTATPSFASPGIGIGVPFGMYWNTEFRLQQLRMVQPINRRHTYRIHYNIDTINSPGGSFTAGANPLETPDDITNNPQWANITNNKHITGVTETPGQIEFLQEYSVDGKNEISSNPAIFETEPKEDADLDIYYEASSSFPTMPLTNRNKELFIPIGTTIEIPNDVQEFLSNIGQPIPFGIFVTSWDTVVPPVPGTPQQVTIYFSTPLSITQYIHLSNVQILKFLRDDDTYVTASIVMGPTAMVPHPVTGVLTNMVIGLTIIPKIDIGLGWHNCWSFGNGVESNRVGDTYNKPFLLNGVAASSVIDDNFKKEHKKYSLIYSGIYNSNSGINSLNQFIAGEKITKDLNPIYGTIQRLKAGWGQGGDLIALCEDRILKILANKDALFNADGNSNVTATNRVLGQAVPYSGEYGISKNPESFASEAYRAYFTDKVRGAVMRLSRDGLTAISDAGMKDWFRDNLKLNNKLVGSFDDKKDEYNICLPTTTEGISKTVSFREDVRGWVSFKSFVTQNGISCANDYFTFKEGELWMHHHDTPGNRNTFYNIFTKTSFDVLLNDEPGIVKSFYTINYEGSDSKVTINTLTDADGNSLDDQYHNLAAKNGWYVNSLFTNKESGDVYEFIEKEGKWFNYIRGKDIVYNPNNDNIIVDPDGDSSWDQDSFAIQGLGAVGGVSSPPLLLGCTNPLAINFDCATSINPNSNVPCNDGVNTDDGSCVMPAPIPGCTHGTADNYDATATSDDGSCEWTGCTDSNADNYSTGWNGTTWPPEAQNYIGIGMVDDGSCFYCTYGCMCDPIIYPDGCTNFDPLATCDGGNCIPTIEGCLGQTGGPALNATGYNASANTDDGSCIWEFCGEPTDSQYNAAADTESAGYVFANGGYMNNTVGCVDGGCTDATAFNYNPAAQWDDGSCIPTISGCMDPNAYNYNDYDADGVGNPLTNDPTIDVNTDDGTCSYFNECYVCGDHSVSGLPGYVEDVSLFWPVDGICPGAALTLAEAQLQFGNGFSVDDCCIPGCTDPQAIGGNNLGTATCDDGSCVFGPPPALPGCMDGGATDYTLGFGDGADGVTANNYDPTAATDDGSCRYDHYCAYCDLTGYVQRVDYLGVSGLNIPPAQLAGGICNPNPNAYDGNEYTIDPTNPVNAQDFVTQGNWEGIQTGDGCIRGCTDPLAANYDASATFDDGSCAAAIEGCTDATAWDYDASANVSLPCSDCTLDPSDSNNWCVGPNTNNGVWNQTDADNYDYMPQNQSISNCLIQHNGEWWQWDDGFGSGADGEPGVDHGWGALWVRCDLIEDTCNGPVTAINNGNWNVVFTNQYSQNDIVENPSNSGMFYIFTAAVNNGQNYEPGNLDPISADANTPWMYCQNCVNCP